MIDFTSTVPVSIGLALFLVILLWIFTKPPRNLPPGPHGWPILGSFLQVKLMEGDMLSKFRRLRSKYGDVFTNTTFGRPQIVVNGIEALREFFIKHADAVSDRPDNFVTVYVLKHHGIIANKGHSWKEHRTFALTTLRSFGFGKRSLENQIMEEVNCFLDKISEQKGEPFNPNHFLHVSVANIICSIVFGKRFEHSDKQFQKLLNLVTELVKFRRGNLLNTIPIVGKLPGDLFGAKYLLRIENGIQAFCRDIVEEHRERFDDENINDYIDAFLHEQKKQADDKASTFTDFMLLIVVRDFFLAGSETTTTTTKWAMTYLVNHPDVQKKMREEIENVIGSRPVSLGDRDNLPYCDAVITETLRMGDIAPLAVPHSASSDFTWKGFTIPKGAMVIPNLDSVMFDEEMFPNPREFKPERFLDDNGKLSGLEKNVICFSLGRRVCLGESLARMELFLFLVSIIQRFELKPSESHPMPSMDGFLGGVHGPYPFHITAVERT